jgi:FtsH-binding integral membrane protein
MNIDIHDDDYDLSPIIARPLYFALGVNVLAPMIILGICYYFHTRSPLDNKVGDFANSLFYLFVGLAATEAAFAYWLRYRTLHEPMIRREETFVADFSEQLLVRSRPVFVIIAGISVYGYAYFYLTGRFPEAMLFVVTSFVVFQFVRPRFGGVRKILRHQKDLADRGQFFSG